MDERVLRFEGTGGNDAVRETLFGMICLASLGGVVRWLRNTESAGKHVSAETPAGKTIVLMERNFWELYFSISAAGFPPPLEGEDLLSSRNKGICTGFYESLPPSSNSLVSGCDMLILLEPAHEAGYYMERLSGIDPGIVLGISSSAPPSGQALDARRWRSSR